MPANIANADRFVHYTPNNSTGPFPVPFPVFDPTGADLEVTLNGQVVTSGWSFTGTLEPGFYGAPNTWVNGSISFDAPISGSLYIEGNRAPRRPAEAQFAEGRGIPARDHNTEFNTLTAICRELFQRLRRTIRVPLGEQGLELPPIADRIGKYVGWDGNGNFIPLQPNEIHSGDIGDNAVISSKIADGAVTDPKVFDPPSPSHPDAVRASKLSFLQAGTDAVYRTVQDKLREWVSVLDFIPASLHSGIRNGTNTTNLESYIQSAIDSVSAGGSLYFPAGTYQVAAALSVVTNHVRIYGASRRGTKIVQQVASAKVFNVTGSYFSLESLSIEYASQGTSGGTAVDISGAFYSTIDDVYIYRPHVGVKYSSSANSHTGARILVVDATQNGVLVDGAVHVLWDKFQILNSNTTTLCTLGCILLAGAVEGCDFINGQTYQGVQSLVTTAPSFAFGQMPSYNKFHAVYFDAATAAVIDKATELDFVDCWFSNRPEHGVYVAQVDGVRFTGGGAINCGKHGVLVESVARRVFFDGFAARSNSVTAANTYSGLYFAAGTVDFGATGCVCTNDLLAFGNQKYGIEIQPGACDRYTLSNNIVVGNATGGIFDGGTGTEKYIHHNVGYRTSARGSAVVPTGNTSATVSHGLDVTPAQADFISVPTVNLGDVGVSRWWIDNVTATTFRLNVDAPTTADAFFAWDVRAKGA